MDDAHGGQTISTLSYSKLEQKSQAKYFFSVCMIVGGIKFYWPQGRDLSASSLSSQLIALLNYCSLRKTLRLGLSSRRNIVGTGCINRSISGTEQSPKTTNRLQF